MSLINVQNLCFKYASDGFCLDNINFEIDKGEIVALIGPNGAGKTTLSKILCGIIEDFTGEIFIDNINIKKLSSKERAKKISYIPQIFESFFDFEIEEIIYMGRRPFSNSMGIFNDNDRTIIENIMKKFNLFNKRKKKFFMLSGGEKRIVLIIRAICQNSDILILDEPLAYLDLHHQIELIRILHKLNREGKTIFLVLHDINIAAEICQKIILMNNGRIVKFGKPEFVLEKKLIKNIYKINNFDINKNPLTKKINIFVLYDNMKGGKR